MAGFIRRFNVFPPIEVLTEIEAIDIIDLAPPFPTTGVGTGTLFTVGEFEDGPFATGDDSPYWVGFPGINEVFSSQDLLNKYGGFGFTYGTEIHQNPCSRRHLQELWNGNGFLKLKFCRPQRLLIGRVDTSVGTIAYSPLASVLAENAGPYALQVGDSFDVATSAAPPAVPDPTPPLAAAVAEAAGAVFPGGNSGFVGGETITIQVDGGTVTPVVFSAADQSAGEVAAKINATLGYAAAVENAGAVDISGIVPGLSGSIVLADVTPGALVAIGHVAGTSTGTGNVGNINAVTASEIASLINADATLSTAGVKATVQDGALKLYNNAPGVGELQVIADAAGSMQQILGLPTELVAASSHLGGFIPAGSRVVQDAAPNTVYVTMQTLTIPAGDAGPFPVKVRPAQDDGSVTTTAAAGAVTTLLDQVTFTELSVTNTTVLQAAKTEPQMDVAYEAVFDVSLALTQPTREANFSTSARISPAVMRKGIANAIKASDCGNRGRKFIGRAPLGFTLQQARQDIAQYRNERLFYTYPGWDVRIPEISAVGAAGGLGFNDSGVITVGGDFPLATLDCRLPPEDNPGQETGLIEQFFQVESVGRNFGLDEYIALKAAGICAPRRDRVSGSIYQSGITSSITPGLTTQARRKMADFIQDSLAERMVPFSKKLATEARKDSIRAIVEQFLTELQSPQNPEIARIADFSVDARSGNTPETEARGIFVLIIRVRTLASLDAIVLQTEIGEGVVVVSEAA